MVLTKDCFLHTGEKYVEGKKSISFYSCSASQKVQHPHENRDICLSCNHQSVCVCVVLREIERAPGSIYVHVCLLSKDVASDAMFVLLMILNKTHEFLLVYF